ncbi:glycosyltransferase family 2 protein [Streptomyces sp. NBC_00101]|uniref:glycosyltransferase family 2 protein n=1 Tax=Streptomyces sp. NBC_00101 TaxID=2975651 RepID=UPI003250174E
MTLTDGTPAGRPPLPGGPPRTPAARRAVPRPGRPSGSGRPSGPVRLRPARRTVRALARRFAEAAPGVRRGLRRLVVLLCLTPLTVVLAHQALRTPSPDSATAYGVVVLAGTIALLYLAYSRYEDPSTTRGPHEPDPGFPPLPTRPRVDFLVAVKDEAGAIEACVRSMAGSDCPGVRIVVVDDFSTDGTRDILMRLRDELGITVLLLDRNVGKKHALVAACARADAEVLAFTDSDCVLAPDALRRCVDALARHARLGAVSGHCRALNADASLLTRIQDTWYEGQFRVAKAAESSFGSVSCVSGPLAVFRREAIYNYLPAWSHDRFLGAPFRFATDRQLTGYVLGQAWIGRSLKERYRSSPFVSGEDHPERRWRVGYVRSAHVRTNVPVRLVPLMRQQVRWKKSFIRNLFFTGSFMWRRGPGPAALFYGHVLWVLAAPLMALRHLVWAPAHGAYFLTLLYVCGVLLKGCVWGLAYRIDHPGDTRWRYRPVMSLFSSVVLAWLLPYSLLTVKRGVWSRSAT